MLPVPCFKGADFKSDVAFKNFDPKCSDLGQKVSTL